MSTLQRAGLATLGLCALALAGPSCGTAYTETVDVVRTATVALDRENTLIVNVPVDVVVEGHPRSSDLVYTLKVTVSASTAAAAETLAKAVVVRTEAVQPGGIQVVVEGLEPRNGQVLGELKVVVPDDLDLSLVSSRGTLSVLEVEGAMQLGAMSHVSVDGAAGSVNAGSQQGNVLVSTGLMPGSVVDLLSVSGSIQLTLPSVVSAQIQATPGGGGQVYIQHPGLPAGLGGTAPYGATVGGGLSLVKLVAQAGNIVIQ